MYSAWSTGLDALVKKIEDSASPLSVLPLSVGNSVARSVIMCIKCGCSCPLSPPDHDPASTSSRDVKGLLGELSEVDLFSLGIQTDEVAKVAIQLLAHGLTMPLKYLDVVSHSVHICCYWLRGIHQLMGLTWETGPDVGTDATSGQAVSTTMFSFTQLPCVMVRHPARYFEAILIALIQFFLPRQGDAIYDRSGSIISSFTETDTVDWKMRKQAAVEDTVMDLHAVKLSNLAFETASTIELLTYKLQLFPLIESAIEKLLSSRTPLPGDAWGSLLNFLLASAHAHLSLPLPVTSTLHHLVIGLPRNQPSTHNSSVASNAAPQISGGVSDLSTGSAASSSAATGSTVSAPLTATLGSGANSSLSDPAWIHDVMSQKLAALLMRAWLKASASEHGPNPQMWAALQTLARQWRHRSAFVCQWSRATVALTTQLLINEVQNDENRMKPSLNPIVDKYGDPLVPRGMPSATVKEVWYRMLRIFGNPSDLCDPHVLLTPVLTGCKQNSILANRMTITPVYLPYIHHQVLTTIGIIVDRFLGLPSLVDNGMTSVPSHLYGLIGALHGDLSDYQVSENEVLSCAPSSTRSSFMVPAASEKSKKSKLVNVTRWIVRRQSTVLMTIAEGSPDRLILSQIPSISILDMGDNLSPTAGGSNATTPPSTAMTGGGSQATLSPLLPGRHNHHQTGSKLSAHTKAQTLMNSWLKPDVLEPAVWKRSPQVNTLLNLFDYWLFEAAVKDTGVDMNVRWITARPSEFPPELSFQAGRAEALAILCRIFLYGKRDAIRKEYLTRFYICVYLGLEVEKKRQDFVLHTLLLHSIDLLRIDLPGINIIIPRLLQAVQHVLRFAKEDIGDDGNSKTIMQPKYSTTAMLRRAAIHHLLSMACVPSQFEGTIIKCLAPLVLHPTDPMTMDRLRAQLSLILFEQLQVEKDSENIRMLICISFVMLQDMASRLSEAPHMSTQRRDGKHDSGITTFGFFSQLVGCYCTLLVGTWSNDLRIVQGLLEIMSSTAYVRLSPEEPTVYRSAVLHLCRFISAQCCRDGKDHTRELHSIIVAAFRCLSVWLVQHAGLLLVDAPCLRDVLATVELGICGVKSNQNKGANYLKARKTLTPASRRVQYAAESCLSAIMSLAGSSTSTRNNNNTSTDSRLVEYHLVSQLAPLLTESASQPREAVVDGLLSRFRYFWSEPGIILGLLNLSSASTLVPSAVAHSSQLPKALLIVRGAFGRYVWVVRMRQLPNCGTELSSSSSGSTRPEQKSIPLPKPWGCYLESLLKTVEVNSKLQPVYFPPGVADIPLVDADYSISKLEAVGGAANSASRVEVDAYKQLIDSQATVHRQLSRRLLQERLAAPYPDPATKAKPLNGEKSFNSIRLLLGHLGYLIPPDLELHCEGDEGGRSTLISNPSDSGLGAMSLFSSQLYRPQDVTFFPLDHKTDDFFQQLNSLDSLPTRTTDTLLVFYVAAGQKKHSEILDNMKSWSNLSADFRSLLNSLGQLVDVKSHMGWTGNPHTSYHLHSRESDAPRTLPTSLMSAGAHAPDGVRTIVYSANSFNELACFCPAQISSGGAAYNLSASPSSDQQSTPQPDPLEPGRNRVAVVWLESWQDGPISHAADCPGWSGIHQLASQQFDCSVTIYLHPLSTSGLCRVGVLRPATAASGTGTTFEAGPLMTGMLVSPGCLAELVRQTVANLCHRRRLASDQPQHVLRSHRLAELAQAYRVPGGGGVGGQSPTLSSSPSEGLLHLFTSAA